MTDKSIQPLKPGWMLKPGPLKTLHDKGYDEYQKEVKVLAVKAKEASKKREKERLDYLFKIDYYQGSDRIMWPYDLAKKMTSSKNTLQMCRETDHLYDYKRENPDYEYNPENYYKKYYPLYENFKDFENDNGSDLEDQFYYDY